MFTRRSRTRVAVLMTFLGMAGLANMSVSTLVYAQLVKDAESWQDDQGVDKFMGTLLGPVWQPVWFGDSDRHGVPLISPLYKQQPAAAQETNRPIGSRLRFSASLASITTTAEAPSDS